MLGVPFVALSGFKGNFTFCSGKVFLVLGLELR
jgi:hypothetical protein